MGSLATTIETALLLIIAFLIGCIIGWFLKSFIFRTTASAQSEASQSAPAPAAPAAAATQSKSEASAPEAAKPAAPEPEKKEEPVKPAETKPAAAKKPAATKKAPAKKPADKASAAKPAAKKAAAKKSTAKAPAKKAAGKPETLTKARAGGADDLKKISGVGPKLEEKLNGLGFYHYDQVAAWKKADIKWVDDNLSFKGRIERDDWVAQAKKLAKDAAK